MLYQQAQQAAAEQRDGSGLRHDDRADIAGVHAPDIKDPSIQDSGMAGLTDVVFTYRVGGGGGGTLFDCGQQP
jgi:hypothetical protein